jgi:hypothetical protein
MSGQALSLRVRYELESDGACRVLAASQDRTRLSEACECDAEPREVRFPQQVIIAICDRCGAVWKP